MLDYFLRESLKCIYFFYSFIGENTRNDANHIFFVYEIPLKSFLIKLIPSPPWDTELTLDREVNSYFSDIHICIERHIHKF